MALKSQPTVHRSVVDFCLWAVAGAGLVLALLTPFTIGPIALPIALALAVTLGRWGRGGKASMLGTLAGASALPLYVAFLDRQGPGEVCRASSDGGSDCVDQMSPWP